MHRFKTTPQKKLVGMLILFVCIPLFLLWYVVFFLGRKPGLDTLMLLAAVAVLASYLYYKYRKQVAELAQKAGVGETPAEPVEDLPEETVDNVEPVESEPVAQKQKP